MNELQKAETTDNALVLLNKAMSEPTIDVERLDKFIQLYERLDKTRREQQYYEAFPKLQDELPSISKDGKIIVNGQIRSNYAKYESIMKVIQPALSKHGFGVSFVPKFDKDKIIVRCRISHTAGHTETADVELPYDVSGSKNNVQAVGSSMTYARRYALCLILNIVTEEEDNDGNKSSKTKLNKKQFESAVARAKKGEDILSLLEENFALTDRQREAIQEAINSAKK